MGYYEKKMSCFCQSGVWAAAAGGGGGVGISTNGEIGSICPPGSYCNRVSGAGICFGTPGVSFKAGYSSSIAWDGFSNYDSLAPFAYRCATGVLWGN